jgi:hypothetical protein
MAGGSAAGVLGDLSRMRFARNLARSKSWTRPGKNNAERRAGDEQARSQLLGAWIIPAVALLIALAAALLFAVGRSYREGYVLGIGLDFSQARIDWNEAIFYGYWFAADVWAISLLVVAASLLVSAGAVWLGGWVAHHFGRKDRRVKKSESSPEVRKARFLAQIFVALAIACLGILYAYGITLVAVNVGFARGRAEAEQLLAEIKKERESGDLAAVAKKRQLSWLDFTLQHDKAASKVCGFRLLCAEQLCVVYDGYSDAIQIVHLSGVRDATATVGVQTKYQTCRP